MFPLPLAAIEEYFLHEDRPAYPCLIFWRLAFEGTLRPEWLEEALEVARSRHPLLSSRVKKERGVWRWEPATDPIPIQWHERSPIEMWEQGEWPTARHQPLQEEVGLRLIVTMDHHAADLVLVMHHSTCDGLGGASFLQDLFLAYQALSEKRDPREKLPAICDEKLALRGSFGLTRQQMRSMIPEQLTAWRGILQFLMRKPQPILPHTPRKSAAPLPEIYPAIVTRRVSAQQADLLSSAAKAERTTSNTMLIRDYFWGIENFRQSQGVNRPQDWIRLMVPISLRSKVLDGISAANVVSVVFLDRREIASLTRSQLAKTVHDEMKLIMDYQLGYTFIISLVARRYLPGGLQGAAAGEPCVLSSILTNLGRALGKMPLPVVNGHLQIGNLTLRSAEAIAPLRPGCVAATSLMFYGDGFTISSQYDPEILTREKANLFIDGFVSQIEQTISEQPAQKSPRASSSTS